MQPHNPMLDTYRSLSAQVASLVQSTIPPRQIEGGDAYSSIRALWSPVPSRLAHIDETLTGLGEAIFAMSTDSRRSDQAKSDDIAAVAGQVRSFIAESTQQITTRSNTLLDELRTLAYPARPGPIDAAQEATLAGIKSDLRMVWDSVDAGDTGGLIAAMSDSLARAIGEHDELSTWLLASSHFPEDYLTSRGVPEWIAAWTAEVANTLDAAAPGDLGGARHVYRILADGRRGLPVFPVLFGQLAGIVSDVAGWRPSTFQPTPPTRVA